MRILARMQLLRDLLRARGIEALEVSSFQLGALEIPHVVGATS